MKTYNICMKNDLGGFRSAALAHNIGSVVSTASRYDGQRDLAIIQVEDADAEYFEATLDGDNNVVTYTDVSHLYSQIGEPAE